MRIRELTLQNYRVYAERPPFSFSDRFTVVAGINGRGKTALLDGLALLCSRFLPHVSSARSGYRPITSRDVHAGTVSAELNMKVTCAGIPIEYKLTYDKEREKIKTTKLSAVVKREVRNAYGDPTRADDAAPLVVYYTTDRAGYRLPKKLPTEVPRGQASAYTGALFNRTVNFRDFMVRYRSAVTVERTERWDNPDYLGDRAVAAISYAHSLPFWATVKTYGSKRSRFACWSTKTDVALGLVAIIGRGAVLLGDDLRPWPTAGASEPSCSTSRFMVPAWF